MLQLDPKSDREATMMLHAMVQPSATEVGGLLERLQTLIRSRTVLIFGCGPSLDGQLKRLGTILRASGCPRMAADGATSALLAAGIKPDIIVTDLDGNIADIIGASRNGAIVILHAHGDNLERVSRWLPKLANVVPVTQTDPTTVVRNFGGFTDGDKCLFLAAAFGAGAVVLVGMDFGRRIGRRSDPSAFKRPFRERKLAKLAIGRQLAEEILRRASLHAYSVTPVPLAQVIRIDPRQAAQLLGATHNERCDKYQNGGTPSRGHHLRDGPDHGRRPG